MTTTQFSIFWGLMAAFGWGLTYFIARYPARALGTARALLLTEGFSLIWLTIQLYVTGEFARLFVAELRTAWGLALLAASINAVANVLYYRAIEVGVLALVTPITATYAAFVVLFALLGGSTITPLQTTGLAVILVGVLQTVIRRPRSSITLDRAAVIGLVLAFAAAVTYGLAYWLLGVYVAPTLGSSAPVWTGRVTTLLLTIMLFLYRGQRIDLTLPGPRMTVIVVVSALLGIVAFTANNIGYAGGSVAIVSVLASLYSAITVLLARFILRERLTALQWSGIVVIIAGVLLVSV